MDGEPSERATTFATTEHFTLQTARSATIAESNGRANLFLAAVSSGLVALAFVAQVTELDGGFLVFGLILLPVLLFIGLVTFDRVLQSGVEDLVYARRINEVRRFYLDSAPELIDYFAPAAPDAIDAVMVGVGYRPGRLQLFLTTAGMIEVLDAVLAGAIAAFVVLAAVDDGLVAAVIVGVAVGGATVALLHRLQRRVWERGSHPSP